MIRKKYTGVIAGTAVLALGLAACSGSGGEGDGDATSGDAGTLTLVLNAISGGKNAAEADWVESWVIPEFEAAMAEEGQEVEVVFEAQGVDDEDYKTKIALDLQSGGGADIIGMDGIWVGSSPRPGTSRRSRRSAARRSP